MKSWRRKPVPMKISYCQTFMFDETEVLFHFLQSSCSYSCSFIKKRRSEGTGTVEELRQLFNT